MHLRASYFLNIPSKKLPSHIAPPRHTKTKTRLLLTVRHRSIYDGKIGDGVSIEEGFLPPGNLLRRLPAEIHFHGHGAFYLPGCGVPITTRRPPFPIVDPHHTQPLKNRIQRAT